MFGPNIDKLEKRGDVDALIEALGNKRRSVRDDAAAALGRLGNGRATEPLNAALRQRRDEWLELYRAFSQLSDKYRYAPGRSLTEPFDPLAVPGGKQAKQAEEEASGSVDVAAEALARLAERGDMRAIDCLFEFWGDAAATELRGRLSTQALVEVLEGGGGQARAAAARWLADGDDPGSADALPRALADADPSVRLAATDALGSRVDLAAGTPAAELLAGALDDADADVRDRAAVALGRIGDPRAAKPLIAALRRRGPDAWAAFELLREQGGSEAEAVFAEGVPKVGDSVKVAVEGEMYAGMPGDRVEMGWGRVGEWTGTVVSVSGPEARVQCDEVEGEVDEIAPGKTTKMRLDPRHAGKKPGDAVHWSFDLR